MYSIVLMMALSGGTETPSFHGRHGDCCGCAGYSGCNGGCYGGHGGCWGGGCNGCHARHHRERGCHHRCHGCNGNGCNGYGCHGYAGNGCCGAYAAPVGCHGGAVAPHPGMMPGKGPAPEKAPPPKPKGGTEEVSNAAPAIIVVTLPAEAKLTIDDNVTKSDSAVRVFASPAIERGRDFSYTLKGEIVREGRTLTTSQEVKVRAGQETRVNLEFPGERVAQK